MKPRALLIANPKATSTSPHVSEIITGALAHEVDLDVITTTHRGHASHLAAETTGIDLLITIGGDGTINEVVNGLLNSGRTDLPTLATIPGGSANVMARALGFPNDPIEATGMILESLRTDSSHTVGLGNARFRPEGAQVEQSQWFTINAGLGIDARVVEAMEAQRAKGRSATAQRYLTTVAAEYLRDKRRDNPVLAIELPGEDPIEGLAMVIVQNTSPWTFLGPFPVNPCPLASFDLGLDVFAPHSLGPVSTVRYGLRMLRGSRRGGVSGGLTVLHDVSAFTVRASAPASLQVDGDAMGLVEQVQFEARERALRILG